VWGARRCGVGARLESGQRRGCGEAVAGIAGGRRKLVGSPLQRRGRMRTVCGLVRGGLVDGVCGVGHVDAWAGAASGGSFRAVAPVAV
jgi:hypothetical protein